MPVKPEKSVPLPPPYQLELGGPPGTSRFPSLESNVGAYPINSAIMLGITWDVYWTYTHAEKINSSAPLTDSNLYSMAQGAALGFSWKLINLSTLYSDSAVYRGRLLVSSTTDIFLVNDADSTTRDEYLRSWVNVSGNIYKLTDFSTMHVGVLTAVTNFVQTWTQVYQYSDLDTNYDWYYDTSADTLYVYTIVAPLAFRPYATLADEIVQFHSPTTGILPGFTATPGPATVYGGFDDSGSGYVFIADGTTLWRILVEAAAGQKADTTGLWYLYGGAGNRYYIPNFSDSITTFSPTDVTWLKVYGQSLTNAGAIPTNPGEWWWDGTASGGKGELYVYIPNPTSGGSYNPDDGLEPVQIYCGNGAVDLTVDTGVVDSNVLNSALSIVQQLTTIGKHLFIRTANQFIVIRWLSGVSPLGEQATGQFLEEILNIDDSQKNTLGCFEYNGYGFFLTTKEIYMLPNPDTSEIRRVFANHLQRYDPYFKFGAWSFGSLQGLIVLHYYSANFQGYLCFNLQEYIHSGDIVYTELPTSQYNLTLLTGVSSTYPEARAFLQADGLAQELLSLVTQNTSSTDIESWQLSFTGSITKSNDQPTLVYLYDETKDFSTGAPSTSGNEGILYNKSIGFVSFSGYTIASDTINLSIHTQLNYIRRDQFMVPGTVYWLNSEYKRLRFNFEYGERVTYTKLRMTIEVQDDTTVWAAFDANGVHAGATSKDLTAGVHDIIFPIGCEADVLTVDFVIPWLPPVSTIYHMSLCVAPATT